MRRSPRPGGHPVPPPETDTTGSRPKPAGELEAPPPLPTIEPPRVAPLKASLQPSPRPQSSEIRILIADGETMFRVGCRRLLDSQSDFTVVGEVGNGVEAVRLAFELKPDVLLLDFSIPELSGLEVLRTFLQANMDVRSILIAGDLDNSSVVEILQLGGHGFVNRRTPGELLCKSIRKVAAGELWIGRDVLTDVVKALSAGAPRTEKPARADFGLTRREREILTHVVEGDSNKTIARRLSVGEDTVKHHLTSIFNKTGVSSRLELALFALHSHLVDSNKY